jgi:hypothetical protein
VGRCSREGRKKVRQGRCRDGARDLPAGKGRGADFDCFGMGMRPSVSFRRRTRRTFLSSPVQPCLPVCPPAFLASCLPAIITLHYKPTTTHIHTHARNTHDMTGVATNLRFYFPLPKPFCFRFLSAFKIQYHCCLFCYHLSFPNLSFFILSSF